jgi:hypothetical protein
MVRYAFRMGLPLLVIMAGMASPARAGGIVAGDTTFLGLAVQDVTVLAGTVFNPGAGFTLPGLSGEGYFTIDRQAQAGSTIAFTGVDSVFAGSYAGLGSYTFGAAGAVGVGSFYGTIDNVVQNVNDPGYASGNPSSFQSGDLTVQVPSFYFKLAGGTLLETGANFTFTATIDGLPPRTPTVLDGTMPVDSVPIYLGDPSNGILVGYSSDRHIYLQGVPEPSSFVLLGAGAIGLGACIRKRRKP